MYNFTPQLTKLLKSSDLYKKYYATNRYTTSGYGMPNCTAYALGRVNQLCDLNKLSYNNFSGFHGNGEFWGNSGFIGETWKRGNIPKLGAIACYNDKAGVDIGGHVAVVERIHDNNHVTLSNSVWRGSSEVGNENSSGWWFLEENILPSEYRPNVFEFKYYLYPPYIDGDTPPHPPLNLPKSNFPFFIIARKKRNFHNLNRNMIR